MYKLFKHQKKVNGEWVDDDAIAPSIDGDGRRDKVISFTSNESCYNGDVTDERWVDVSIIDGECNKMPQDYDDTKQEYLGCFDGRTPSVTIKGGPENTKIQYQTYNTEQEISNWDVNLDENGNGYFELKDDEILYRVFLPEDNGQPNYPLSEVYIKGCNVATANPIGGYGKIVFSCSTIISDRPNYNVHVYNGAYSYIYNGVDTSKSTTMMNMFYGCSKLTSLDLSGWNTSKVKNMDGMFQNCSGLTSLDLSSFDTRNVTDMESMFEGCSKLKSLDLRNFNTSNVTDMDNMFSDCSGLTSLDVSHFNTSKVTDISGMFSSCSGITSLNVSHFNTSNVTYMSYMFANCIGITSLDLSGWNTSKVTYMNGMFANCSGLTSLDVSHFNTSKVKEMSVMFKNCSGLTSLDLSSFDTRNVTHMMRMFNGCSKLKSLDLSNFNTSGVKDMSWMFDYCISLTSLDLSGWDISRAINKPTFSECSKLKTIRMVGCDQDTIDVIKSILSKDGILNQVTIIT